MVAQVEVICPVVQPLMVFAALPAQRAGREATWRLSRKVSIERGVPVGSILNASAEGTVASEYVSTKLQRERFHPSECGQICKGKGAIRLSASKSAKGRVQSV